VKVALLLALAAGPAEFFETRVRPVFATRCSACHNARTAMGGLDLSNEASFRKATSNGEKMIAALGYSGKVRMPPSGKLADAEIEDLRRWVASGAPWPRQTAQRAPGSHWAFEPVRDVKPPSVRRSGWVRTPVDAFVLARLEAEGLAPADPAPRRELLRRLTFDLTGLPPTAAELAAFEADASPDAYERVVEDLLARPQYGEKWGRNWLDVARYADSTGMDEDHNYPHAWRYRDWVIGAFNRDLPYDRFLQQQIAGDLLGGGPDGIVATGFLAVGPKPLAQQDRVKMIYDVVDEQIDTLSKAVLGLSIACARCHDHKFDPITTKDYYSLAAIFANTRSFRDLGRPGSVSYLHYTPLDQAAWDRYMDHRRRMWAKRMEMEAAHDEDLAAVPNSQPWRDKLASWRKRFQTEAGLDRALPERPKPDDPAFDIKDSPKTAALRAEWQALEKTLPPEPALASAVCEGPAVEQRVFLRGDHHSPGEVAPKAFPAILARGEQPAIRAGSGRTELARWITRADNPLTARVMVNRIWQGHFGEGLVRTPNNWGLTGERPTHPELLDWLARRFVDAGWSVKQAHREIVLSSAYRMSATAAADALRKDPSNRLLSRFPRRRLTIEEIRDGMLAVSGSLDRTFGGSLMGDPAKKRGQVKPEDSRRRTVYLHVRRGSVPVLLSIFDYGDATTPGEGRSRTTVAQQALFLRNSAFVRDRAEELARRTETETGRSRVESIFLAVLNRHPDGTETDDALSHAAKFGWASLCAVLFSANEFLYVN